MQLLKQKGISAAQMSRELGFSNSVFTQWKQRKQQPSIDKVRKMANYFGVTVDDLMPNENRQRYADAAHVNELVFKSELEKFGEQEQLILFAALNKTVDYINRSYDPAAVLTRLSGIIGAYGEMLQASWSMKFNTKDRPNDYIVFMRHYQRCIDQLNTHKDDLVNTTLGWLDDDTKLRELIYGEDGKK
jgi:transcriptional regulator with XRE-family HTH domain